MRIRYLKPEFFKDEHLKDLPFETRLLFEGLWCMADREGRLQDRTERIKIEVFPYDNIDIEKNLELLAKVKNGVNRPFIIRYIINNDKYIQIVNWHKHQRIHHTEAISVFPPYISPLNTKGKGKGKAEIHKCEKSCSEVTDIQPLDNGERTVKDKFLEFVYLTKEEYSKLQALFEPEHLKDLIERLNNYIGSKGKQYNSHYHTILCWDRKDNPNKASDTSKRRVL